MEVMIDAATEEVLEGVVLKEDKEMDEATMEVDKEATKEVDKEADE